MIRINNLLLKKKAHKIEREILRGVSLELPASRVTLLLGKSGSGKTSILRCISHLEKAYSGEIFHQNLNGPLAAIPAPQGRVKASYFSSLIPYRRKNLTASGQEFFNMSAFSLQERSQHVGFVSQSYSLFPFMTVLENCAHPLRKILGYHKAKAQEKSYENLTTLGMEHLIHSFPHQLSGGQQQRTTIIRALGLNPTFLLLDEPTSALDPENTRLLIQIILRLKAEGKGIIISSQDMSFASKILDRAYFLEEGKIIEQFDSQESNSLIDRESKLRQFLFAIPEEKPETELQVR